MAYGGIQMGEEERKERQEGLRQAQNYVIKNDFQIICNNPEATVSIIRIINAIRNEGYQLYKMGQVIDEIDKLATEHRSNYDYLDMLDDVTQALKRGF